MYWHIDADIISLIVIAALLVCNNTLPPQDELALRNRRFSRCLTTGAALTLIDIATALVREFSTSRVLYHLFMTTYLVTIELVIVEWMFYVLTLIFKRNEKGYIFIEYLVSMLYAVYAILNILNPWTQMVYTLGPNNEYTRGPLFPSVLILYAAYTLLLFILILVRRKHISEYYSVGVLFSTPAIITIGIVTQLMIPGWLFIMPSYMICLLLALLFFQTKRIKVNQERMKILEKAAATDPLIGVLNRGGLEEMVNSTLDRKYGYGVVVMLVDIDDLKKINDNLGHAEGDRAIKLMAKALKGQFRSNDTVVRYGGDEFLVFFTGTIGEERIHHCLRALSNTLGSINIGEHDEVNIHASIGAAYGTVGEDSFESLRDKADAALYYTKRNGKNNYSFYKGEDEFSRIERP